MYLPIGEYMPDQPSFGGRGSATIHNVYPKTQDSYGPLSSFVNAFTALAAKVQGSYTGMDSAGNVEVFAGTATKLYSLGPAATSFTDASGATYTTATDSIWRFTQFGQRVLATNYADAIQTFTLNVDSAFSDLAAAAPKARYITTVKDFVMVGNTNDTTYGEQPQRIWWSAINDSTNWPTPGTTTAAQVQSDYQDIPGEQGWIQGLVGNLGTADVAIFFERAIWRGVYVGSPDIFSFQPAEGVRGCPAPGSIAQLGAVVFYLGEDGFYMFDGSNSTPIGAEKIDKTFYADVNQSYMYRICSAVDPINKLVFWAYPGSGSVNGTCNKLLIYNWSLNRWSDADCDLDYIVRALTFGYTLDSLDTTGYNLDTLPFSLDSRVWTGGSIILGGFDSSHRFGYFTGSNLAPTVETPEVELGKSNTGNTGSKVFIRFARPIVDGGTPSVAMGGRDRQIDSVTYNAASSINTWGECPQRLNTRYARAKITLPSGSSFTHISGVNLTVSQAGKR